MGRQHLPEHRRIQHLPWAKRQWTLHQNQFIPRSEYRYSDTTVQGGDTYFYVTTAVDNQGVESAYSNQSEATIPGGGSGTESALYSFAGGSDPKLPYAGLIFDKAGNLYGTTEFGGTNGQGTVFEITPTSSGWTETVLYNFTGSADGGQPYASLIFDSAGNLYGTTNFGGSSNCNMGCGTVFKLTPGSGGWTESVLYTFTGGNDGREPYARLRFDAAGNLYGTTLLGGNIGSVCSEGCGTVFKLTPGTSGWTESVLYAFQGAGDGAAPYDGLALDAAGNLYGTAYTGGASADGVIFKLTPGTSGWTESVLHTFKGLWDGKYPYGDLILDATGNLYGTAYQGGSGYGVVFELMLNTERSLDGESTSQLRQHSGRKSRCRPGHGRYRQSVRHHHARRYRDFVWRRMRHTLQVIPSLHRLDLQSCSSVRNGYRRIPSHRRPGPRRFRQHVRNDASRRSPGLRHGL